MKNLALWLMSVFVAAHAQGQGEGSAGCGIVLIVLGGVAYFIPLLVAGSRKHPNEASIGLLNLLLGWTVIGWVVALVWAFGAIKKISPTVASETSPSSPVGATRACPFCAEKILTAARKCKHCGEMVDPTPVATEEDDKSATVVPPRN